MALIQHPKPISNTKPPLEYLEKYVIKDTKTAHWFWNDNRRNHGHDSKGQPTLEWTVKPTHKTFFESHGKYSVMRLLYEYTFGPIESGTVISNVCGLPQCVNSAHWQVKRKGAQYRLELRRPNGWVLVSVRTHKTVSRDVSIRLRDLDGLVHVVRAVPHTPLRALCGTLIDPSTALVVSDRVSCTGGC